MRGPIISSAPAFFLAALLAPMGLPGAPIIVSASGSEAGDIQAAVDFFRGLAGDPDNGNAPGPLPDGRREIDWDAGGSLMATLSPSPFTGFADTRGAAFSTPGTGFIQSPPPELISFSPSYPGTFAAFSPARLFSPVDSNVTDVFFSVPGTDGSVPATVSAFGAVFSDVDTEATTLQFFGPGDEPLGTFAVPAIQGDQTFSFLGLAFVAGERVSRVRITTGNAALGPDDGGGVDVVMMDDLIFSEPKGVIPEPATVLMVALGLLGVAARRRASR